MSIYTHKPVGSPGECGEEEYSIEEHLKSARPEVRSLLKEFDSKVRELSEEIWAKTYRRGVTYFSPERVFIYPSLQKQCLRLTLFTRGQRT